MCVFISDPKQEIKNEDLNNSIDPYTARGDKG